MLKINKVAEPDFLKSYKRKHKPKNWDDYNEDNIKFELKTYIVENEQKINEGSLCVYCEREINVKNNDGHIEHIKPKDKILHIPGVDEPIGYWSSEHETILPSGTNLKLIKKSKHGNDNVYHFHIHSQVLRHDPNND
jgi:hypothetical protein